MISLQDYFGPYQGHPDATPERWQAASLLLEKVNALLDAAKADGIVFQINPSTGTLVGGQTNGGFRPQDCPVGAPKSTHKLARAVDIYDRYEYLDDWLTDSLLTVYGLYREAPEDTFGWCHLTDKPPGSGRRTFRP